MMRNKGEYKAGNIFYVTETKRKAFRTLKSGNPSSFWTEEM